MKNKRFTLIELLAVIVILAIIALIAVPHLNIILYFFHSLNLLSYLLYLILLVERAIARKDLTEEFNPTECTVNEEGNLNCDGTENSVSGISGYWTSAANPGSASMAWFIEYDNNSMFGKGGRDGLGSVNSKISFGLRPTITLLKYLID